MVSSAVDSFDPHTISKEEQNVTKSEFVDQVANRAEMGKSDAGKAVDAVLDTIQETLQRGSDVTFSGFGKFHVAERGARQGVHPRTGEPIDIAASKVPRFSAGSGLKKAVNG
jgi:DNA-binding protein HU-beta